MKLHLDLLQNRRLRLFNRMKYKLIISDLDATLIGKEHVVSTRVQGAIKKWMDAGGLFTVASGRMYKMIIQDCKGITFNTPIITRGGSEIVDSKTGKVVFSKNIDSITLQKLMNVLRENNFKAIVEKDDVIYASFPYVANYPTIQIKDLTDFVFTDVPKVLAKAQGEDLTLFEDTMGEVINKFPQLHIVQTHTPDGSGWDITSLAATKHLAVLELIKMLNLTPEEVVGVGDGYNDIPLLEAVGFKVAMGNAKDELKEIADVVVPSYKEDGVAVLIEDLLEAK